jgi:ketosteroid isomerase-like protein
MRRRSSACLPTTSAVSIQSAPTIAKADIIASAGSLDYEPETIANDVRRVRLFGDVAVVTAQGTARGRYKGQRADMVFAYTRIWVKRNDLWQAVAAHASPVG